MTRVVVFCIIVFIIMLMWKKKKLNDRVDELIDKINENIYYREEIKQKKLLDDKRNEELYQIANNEI